MRLLCQKDYVILKISIVNIDGCNSQQQIRTASLLSSFFPLSS